MTDRPEERFSVGRRVFLEGETDPLTIVEAVRERLGWRVRFAEVGDRTAAEVLRGRYLEADVVEPLPPGHHYWHDLIGIPVRDEAGRFLGRVVDVYRAGGAEVFSVGGGPSGEVEVPAVRDVVRRLDPGGEGIVVDRDALGLPSPGESASADSAPSAGSSGSESPAAGSVEPLAPGRPVRRGTTPRARLDPSSAGFRAGEGLAPGGAER